MTSKKKKIIWLIIAFFTFEFICVGIWWMAENSHQNEARAYFCEIIKEHMENDNDFAVSYGSPVSVEYYDQYDVDKTADGFVCVPCLVKTELNTYMIWVDLGESETGYEVSYHSIIPISEVE